MISGCRDQRQERINQSEASINQKITGAWRYATAFCVPPRKYEVHQTNSFGGNFLKPRKCTDRRTQGWKETKLETECPSDVPPGGAQPACHQVPLIEMFGYIQTNGTEINYPSLKNVPDLSCKLTSLCFPSSPLLNESNFMLLATFLLMLAQFGYVISFYLSQPGLAEE